jgi:hypothetical protein
MANDIAVPFVGQTIGHSATVGARTPFFRIAAL